LEPEIPFSEDTDNQPKDYLTKEERTKIREAALEYGSIPAYNTVTPEERSRWKGYLAQRFGKSKSEIGLEDWERANGWKIPGLVWVSLDCGLRPIEVERATVDWIDLDNMGYCVSQKKTPARTETIGLSAYGNKPPKPLLVG
jgi:integrase